MLPLHRYAVNAVHLCMGLAILAVISFTDDPFLVHQHSAYHWVWRYVACTQSRQLQAAVHVCLVKIQAGKDKEPLHLIAGPQPGGQGGGEELGGEVLYLLHDLLRI